jgi:hypothetical protein
LIYLQIRLQQYNNFELQLLMELLEMNENPYNIKYRIIMKERIRLVPKPRIEISLFVTRGRVEITDLGRGRFKK